MDRGVKKSKSRIIRETIEREEEDLDDDNYFTFRNTNNAPHGAAHGGRGRSGGSPVPVPTSVEEDVFGTAFTRPKPNYMEQVQQQTRAPQWTDWNEVSERVNRTRNEETSYENFAPVVTSTPQRTATTRSQRTPTVGSGQHETSSIAASHGPSVTSRGPSRPASVGLHDTTFLDTSRGPSKTSRPPSTVPTPGQSQYVLAGVSRAGTPVSVRSLPQSVGGHPLTTVYPGPSSEQLARPPPTSASQPSLSSRPASQNTANPYEALKTLNPAGLQDVLNMIMELNRRVGDIERSMNSSMPLDRSGTQPEHGRRNTEVDMEQMVGYMVNIAAFKQQMEAQLEEQNRATGAGSSAGVRPRTPDPRQSGGPRSTSTSLGRIRTQSGPGSRSVASEHAEPGEHPNLALLADMQETINETHRKD